MILLHTTRRCVAVRSRLLAIASLCLCALLVCAASSAAQGMGGGGRHGMGMGDRMHGPRMGFAPNIQPLPSVHIGLQLGLGGRWWDESRTIKKLHLRSDQQQRMDDIFESNKGTLVTLYNNLQREETHLATLPAGDLQDETKVFAAIDRVSQARADLEKENVHMLMQIRQQLDPDQLQQLDREIASAH